MQNPDLQAAVSELRGLQECLVFELVVEPELELTREQHRNVLATGRAGLLASGDAVREDSRAVAACADQGDGPEEAPQGACNPRSNRSAGPGWGSPLRVAALSGTVAACVAIAVSWVTTEWKGGTFARNAAPVHQPPPVAYFEQSDVPEFDEAGGVAARAPSSAARPATTRIAGVNAAAPEGVAILETRGAGETKGLADSRGSGGGGSSEGGTAGSAGNPVTPAAVPEIPRLQDMIDGAGDETLFGAGPGKLQPGVRFSRARRDPGDLGSRALEEVPEPPEGWREEPESAQDGDASDSDGRTIELPYQWTTEFSKSAIPTDVDTVSYTNVRRYLRQGQLPPRDSVHVEEMINYFDYEFKPSADGIFGVDVERAICPWQPEHELLRIAVRASAPDAGVPQAPRNYVFLIDTSDSMQTPARLGMLSESAGQLVNSLGRRDKVTILTYEEGAARLVAGPLPGDRRDAISHAFLNLDKSRKLAGTPIRIAYRAARNARIAAGENRIVLVTDSDLQAGAGSAQALLQLARLGDAVQIGLTVAGIGGGVLDAGLLASMEVEAGAQVHYLDGAGDAARFFGKALARPATVLASQVAISVEFNADAVRSYRLIGYANRPAGARGEWPRRHSDVCDGDTLTALYELIPVSAPVEEIEVGSHGSEAQRAAEQFLAARKLAREGAAASLLKISLLYDAVGVKLPKHTTMLMRNDPVTPISEMSSDFQFAAAVAGFGLLLRESPYRGILDTGLVAKLAESGLAFDPHGLRREFADLVRAHQELFR